MKTCALVGASDFNDAHFLYLYEAGIFDEVIAVDGGFASLKKVHVVPQLVLGDFDSLGYIPDDVPVQSHPVHKDASDMELAMEEASTLGYEKVVVYGALSGRLDHTVANLQLFARFSEQGKGVCGIGDNFAVQILTGPASFDIPVPPEQTATEARGTVSLFSACDVARGITEHGLEYPLENATLTNRTSLGLSNELIGCPASVFVQKGTLYVFYPLK